MKILLFLFLSISLFAKHIEWRANFDEALFEAKSLNKDIMLLVLKKDSSRSIFSNIFIDKTVENLINAKYIGVVAFFEDKNSYPIELFYTQDLPALFFVSSQDESFLYQPLTGKFTKEDITRLLKD